MQYVGAYKNLTWKPGPQPIDEYIKPLVGKTKLAGTQVIDAPHILKLIGSKVNIVNGVQAVDSETLRIIYEQIQEISDMGEYEQALFLREFVDTELLPGNLTGVVNFDEAFEMWKDNKLKSEVDSFASEWGIDSEILAKSVNAYSNTHAETVPYINDIICSVNYGKARNQTAGNLLKHNMTLTTTLPIWIAKIKQMYK